MLNQENRSIANSIVKFAQTLFFFFSINLTLLLSRHSLLANTSPERLKNVYEMMDKKKIYIARETASTERALHKRETPARNESFNLHTPIRVCPRARHTRRMLLFKRLYGGIIYVTSYLSVESSRDFMIKLSSISRFRDRFDFSST